MNTINIDIKKMNKKLKKIKINADAKNSISANRKTQKRKHIERLVEFIFLFCALVAIISVGTIAVFVFIKGMPALVEIGFLNFLTGKMWKPSAEVFGILPMILSSLYVTIGAIVIGVPIGILSAVFMAELAPKWMKKIIRPIIDLLAGIPSVVHGLFGLLVIVPFIKEHTNSLGGDSLLAAMIVLGIMILPTVISISESSINQVPKTYKEASLGMGASKIQTIFKVIIPAAKSGIITAIVLGIGRAIGETMAVILVAGNAPQIPTKITDMGRTLTANIAMEMNYAFGLHQEALFATGVVLFCFIMLINIVLNIITRKDY
jgi:phosphate transport system permease protein